ncbi:hypothetical protein [Defluviimonas sp. SAOS-178_SWC]|uniref:hypothetical protein n=1 Tax=Defluviimonas sp. SAOS-178_SWC TaxID=3121287 RepID=UPI00322157A6
MFSRLIAPVAALAVLIAAPARAASDEVAALEAALQLPDVFAVMSQEGHVYGAQMETDMFPGAGGALWAAAVAQIYSVDRILPAFSERFEAELSRPGADTAAMLDFFDSDLGRKVTTLEISARRALLDEAVEDASRLKYDEMRAVGDPQVALVEEFVSVNGLIEANVSGAMNANYAFYQGLGDAGALGPEMTEDDIIGEIWSQEDVIRDETDIWIHSYLAMAYAPLSDSEMRDYIAFSRTEAGKALNAALFSGFDAVFVDVSRQLGQQAGRILAGRDL